MTATGSTHTHGEKTGRMAGASHPPFLKEVKTFPEIPPYPFVPLATTWSPLVARKTGKAGGGIVLF